MELLDELCLDLLDLDFLDEDLLDDFLGDFLDDLCDCDAFLGFRAFDAETVSLDAGMSSHCCFYRAVSNVATISDEPLQRVSGLSAAQQRTRPQALTVVEGIGLRRSDRRRT